MNDVPTMLTVRQTAETCNVSEHFIRQLIRENRIVYVTAGSKFLVNLEKFVGYLNGETT